VAGEEDGHRLVAQLAIVHRLAGLLVTGLDQHGEQVAPVARAPAPLGDHLQHHRVERGERATEAAVLAGGDQRRQIEDAGAARVGEREQEGERGAHLVGRVGWIGAEQRLADDA